MHSFHKSTALGVLLLLAILQVQAQVTGEGNAPFDTSSSPTMTVSITDFSVPSGSKAPSYYSSVYPQTVTAVPSGATSSASTSSSTHKIVLAVVLSLVLSCVLFAGTLFVIRHRMRKASLARRRRASWALKTSQWPHDQKHDPESLSFRNPSAYPFAPNFDAKVPVPPATFASNRGV
ncbi:hypothetical protein PILCRDRAFT_812297 [Piloderma croceum F 1598]|uniref:Mid2 domain-containing protein n=1 Tax=Piloderma croceum (strain F 1598) TaxID=765440 RepID=A0A0C3GFU9_PILCF|nr:hypothetical protein PILCRDRAFT_812297 [Piloderma croceum F 1598]